MTPVLARILWWISLVKEMPVALPVTEAVGIIQTAFRIHIVINGPVRIVGHLLP
jgi:hypothetical protein